MRHILHLLWSGVWVAGPILLGVLLWRLAAIRGALHGLWDAKRPGLADVARRTNAFGAVGALRPLRLSSGNVAFDEWRDGELGRLAERRREIDTTGRRFAAFLVGLRRAKDRDEFDRFKREAETPAHSRDVDLVRATPGNAPPAS